MFEAYAIGITLKVNNLITPALGLIAKEFERLDGLCATLTASLKKVGTESPALKKLAKDSAESSIGLDKATRAAERLERQLAALRATGASLAGSGALPALGGPGGAGGGGHGGGGGYHRGGFHGGNIHMGPGGVGIGTVGLAAGDAFVPLAVGAGMLFAGHSLYEAAKDLDTERARFKLFGLSAAQNREAFEYADSMKVYGATRAENMRNFREAQGVFRESGESDSAALAGAKLAAPVLSQLNVLAEALGGENGAKMATANMAMLRYVELSGGLKDAKTFNAIADFGWKMNQSSGGTVDWQQLLAFKKTAGSAGYNLTEDALARLEPLMAEMSGGRAGTADATAYNRIMGITRVPNQVAHALVDNGLWDRSRVIFNANGGIKNMKGNPLSDANSKLFHENPELFYEQVMRPIYKKMKLDGEAITRENAMVFGRTGGAFFNAIERSLPVIQKGVEAINRAKGIADSIKETKLSLTGQEMEFDAAWKDFKTQFGTTMMPFFTDVLKAGSTILRAIGTMTPSKALAIANPLLFPGGVVDAVGDGLGSTLSDLINDPNADANDALKRKRGESPFVSTAVSTHLQVNTKINLDGREVARVVSKHQARDASRPQSGGGAYDTTLTPAPAGG